MFGRLMTKRLPSVKAPPPPSKETRLCEAEEEEQSKHALTVAIASAAAAEAAIHAAQVAVEVVRLQSAHQLKEKPEELQPHLEIEESAAIKIQTAFRGYLVSFCPSSNL